MLFTQYVVMHSTAATVPFSSHKKYEQKNERVLITISDLPMAGKGAGGVISVKVTRYWQALTASAYMPLTTLAMTCAWFSQQKLNSQGAYRTKLKFTQDNTGQHKRIFEGLPRTTSGLPQSVPAPCMPMHLDNEKKEGGGGGHRQLLCEFPFVRVWTNY